MNDQVIDAYRQTATQLLIDPDSPEYLTNQYTLLSTTPRSPAQLALAHRAFQVAPTSFIAAFNYASALSRGGYDCRAQLRIARDLSLTAESDALVLHHMGLAEHDQGNYATALHLYEEARKIQPDRPTLHQSIAIAKLAMGRLREGLYEFEVKHHVKPRKPITESGIPWWAGEDLTGKSVILTHEQGFGDTLQFIRFAPLLKARCARLTFSGPHALAPLIAEQFYTDETFDDVISEEGPFDDEHYDYVTSPMAAAALMGIEYKDVSGLAYMRADPISLPPRGRLKIGLSWKGSPGFQDDALRSGSLAAFAPLFDMPGLAFYSLQVRPGPTEISNMGLDGFIADLGSTFKDWRDTAAAISAMDLVIATDSANAHMAGALGKPVFLLLGRRPDWRWAPGHEGRTPWYAGHKIYRQRIVDEWPMAEVKKDLQRLVKAVSSQT